MEPVGSYSPREAFALAVRIEEEGREFYLRAAEGSVDEGVVQLFRFLAEAEREHARKFHDLLSTAPRNEEQPEAYDDYLRSIAGVKIFPDKVVMVGEREALELAMEAERMSILFYSEAAALARTRETAATFRTLVANERDHLNRLLDIKFRIFPG